MTKPSKPLCELLILRHGKSDWSTNDTDFYRPLKNRGKRNAQQMGSWLAEQELYPDVILSSPATRALTSAEKACKSMGQDTSVIHTNKYIYEADKDELLSVLSEVPAKTQRVLLVGHNPGLEDLLVYLAKEITIPDDGKLLPTATLAHLQLSQSWNKLQAHKATVQTIIRPKSLPALFPFPLSTATEYRQRPAYYYSQSAIIPYRCSGQKLEILLVCSSSNKHWIVPKGIIEPGLSPLKSAEKEALEEAGVSGVSYPKRLGDYHYDKWGAKCSVEVFAMEVTQVLPESQWHENHRKRLWVNIETAKKLIKQTAFVPIMKKLQQQIKPCHV